jgi:hypothetical protein
VESAPSHYVDWERCMKKKTKGNQRNEINQPKKGEERGEKKRLFHFKQSTILYL